MNPLSWKEMIKASRELESALGDGVKKIEKNESASIVVQRRSIRVNQKLAKGTIIKESMLEYLRPCPKGALSPSSKKMILNNIDKKILKKGLIMVLGGIQINNPVPMEDYFLPLYFRDKKS